MGYKTVIRYYFFRRSADGMLKEVQVASRYGYDTREEAIAEVGPRVLQHGETLYLLEAIERVWRSED